MSVERQNIPLSWLVLKRNRLAGARATLKAGIPKCLFAGWMGSQILASAQQDNPPILKADPVTPERLARLLEEERGIDASNVKTRYWRPYRPVLHFCIAAFQLAERNVTEGYGRSALINHLLNGAAPLDEFVRMAEALESLIMGDPRLTPPGGDLRRVKIRPGSPGR